MKDFKSLSEAEAALNIDYVLESGTFQETSSNTPPRGMIPEDASLSPIFSCSPAKQSQPFQNRNVGDLVKEFLCSMSTRLKSQILNHLFKLTLVEDEGLEFFKFVKSDFLPSSVRAMETL